MAHALEARRGRRRRRRSVGRSVCMVGRSVCMVGRSVCMVGRLYGRSLWSVCMVGQRPASTVASTTDVERSDDARARQPMRARKKKNDDDDAFDVAPVVVERARADVDEKTTRDRAF